MTGGASSSSLLLDEFLEAGDARALPELLGSRAQKKLAGVGQALFTETRPFARKLLEGYIADGCDRPGHRVFVKTLFKLAEKANDTELLGHFAVAFDRLVKRRLVTQTRWDWQNRRSVTEQLLSEPKELLRRLPRWRGAGKRSYTNPVSGLTTRARRPYIPLVNPHRHWGRNPKTNKWESIRSGGGEERADPLVFTFSTRRYLQRRTWRFFRKLFKQSTLDYRQHVLPVLARYRDEHLASTESLLDAWFLVHALYGGSDVLQRAPLGVKLVAGKNLSELQFAPFAPDAWKEGHEALLELVLTAGSRPVRRFAIWALETHHASQLQGLTAARMIPLLKSAHEEVQRLGGKVLETAKGLETLPISDWLQLLSIANPEVLLLVCAAVKRHVAPSRLSLEQCIELACARAAPVAELGLEWAKARPIRTAKELETLLRLRNAEAAHVRQQGMEWVAQQLILEDAARPLLVRELLDARHVDVRKTAMELMQRDSRFGESIELWLAMSETPYADVRDRFLTEFEAREARFSPDTLQRVWATTLLSVHRGSRAKRHAARQVAERIVSKPEEAAALVKLLGYSLRSVRHSERRTALAQVVRAATLDVALKELLARELPELRFVGSEVTE
ncbi:MAG: hypothetical protein Q8K32_37570 [Archangium sp.]|nr:hypothetical protein [Archangium sp.]